MSACRSSSPAAAPTARIAQVPEHGHRELAHVEGVLEHERDLALDARGARVAPDFRRSRR